MKKVTGFILVFVSVVVACAGAVFAADIRQDGFEPAPILAGADLAPSVLLKGPFHSVAEPVKVEGFLGRFGIESKFGKFNVSGAEMLAVRVNELPAIEALQKVQKDEAFKDSLVKSAKAPVDFAGNLITDPAKTVETVGKGFGSVLGKAGYTAKSGIESVSDAASDQFSSEKKVQPKAAPGGEPEPPSFIGDPFGYNKARREWAMKLNIDPYSTNPVLRPLLDDAAKASFAGGFAVGTAIGFVAAPLSYALSFDAEVRDAVWNKAPVDLQKQNEQNLKNVGVSGRVVRDFFRNKWFTPTLQTALVGGLQKLAGVSGLETVIQAAAQTQGETRARFLLQSVRMLALYHVRDGKLSRVKMNNLVPVGIAQNGALVAAVAIDYASWDKEAAQFAKKKELTAGQRTILVSGKATERAKQEFGKLGWTVREGFSPATRG